MKPIIVVAIAALWTLTLLPVSGFAAVPSTPGPACQGVDQNLTSTRTQTYSALVARAVVARSSAATVNPTVQISRFMGAGAWSLVWAEPRGAEEGVFFFERSGGVERFKDVWGGHALPSERAQTVQWARGRGAGIPNALVQCFAGAVTAGS